MAVLRVFPHCDIHLTLDNPATRSISFTVFQLLNAVGPYTLSPITNTCTPRYFAPHATVGSRLQRFANVDVTTGTITATGIGTNLVILETADTYIVIRIQVHQNILAWWFGNEKITTAQDPIYAHSQPSIYAMFSDDTTGTDRVGDITGHNFVRLSSGDTTILADPNSDGRIRGVAEGETDLEGSFLSITETIDVRVINYAQTRNILEPVKFGDMPNAANIHNILFVAEGFTAADEAKFDQIVTQVSTDLFLKQRHEPYGTLSSSINVFKAFTASNDRLVTCGFQVADNQISALSKGTPIPYEHKVSGDNYLVSELVRRVGLPMRGEDRNVRDLKDLWNSQGLNNFDDAKVSIRLVNAWKNSHSLGFLETRDTFFGMILGSRWADNNSTLGAPLAAVANDDDSAPLKAFVKRAYTFYSGKKAARSITMDPRRHPPELLFGDSRATSFMSFVGGLGAAAPNQTLGSAWVPDGTFKKSRGLIAMISNEHMHAGTNLNSSTLTANTINQDALLNATYVPNPNANIKKLRRDVPDNLSPSLDAMINTVAHEFGHSFNLGDEYEEFVEYSNFATERLNPSDTTSNFFDNYDNIASLEVIFDDANYLTNNSREIDPSKLKWNILPRIKLSAKLTSATQMNGGNLEVTVNSREANSWEAIRVAGDEVHLRRIVMQTDQGQQLPLSMTAADLLTGLTIVSVDESNGTIVLSSAGTLVPSPSFPEGASLYVPLKIAGVMQNVIEDKVFTELVSSKLPLNKDTDTSAVSKKADFPHRISDFKPPCQSARLVGLFEGGATWTGLVYRPAGTCKMRTSSGGEEHGEFCYVCKWLITNRVDPGKHHVIHTNFYPVAKKNE
ncbi:hypothetical protein MNBD_GAMMA12-3966 [hydrothermal vent metagenome]|uniref:Uncharacterized protein n=1 Tax=hydrothermal vent metagenome TaxID=652676 RepID=A0A3B0YMM0_9ZZZZ